MAKRAKAPVVEPVLSPWMLCIWRGEVERCHYGLVRFKHGGLVRAMTGVQAMFTAANGTISYREYRPDCAHLAEPTTVQTSVDAMVAYFRRRLLLTGGDAGAYVALGVERPQVVIDPALVIANPEKTRELEDLYARAAVAMGVPAGELRERYSHLNRGLQAMNLRNRLRARGHNV